jgi:penicillin amidase
VARGYRRANEFLDWWQGYVPFDVLPRMENPARGYVASANNRVAPDDYPFPLHGAWAAGHRATRIKQALEGGGPFDRAQMVALQNDVKNCRAERLCPPLLQRLAASDDPDVRLLCETLRAWDYRYTRESAAPLLFESFMHAWQARVAAERFPARLAPLVTGHGSAAALLIERGPDNLAWFDGGPAAANTALAQAAREAVARVRERLGRDVQAWRWDALHVAHWQHVLSDATTAPAFDVGPSPVDGGADTVRNTGVSATFQATSGAEYRLVVDFAAPDRFWAVQNVGNSGQPGSHYYADQFPAWLAGEYHVVHLRRDAVEADKAGEVRIVPAGASTP